MKNHRNLESKKIFVGQTVANGKGLFAKQSFKKNETIFFIRGKIVSENYDARYELGPRWVSIAPQKWLDPHADNGLWFLNHSCAPNAVRLGSYRIAALRPIRKEEEITLDYSTTEEDPFWKMTCRCSAKKCRRIVRSIQFLPRPLFKKYETGLPAHLRRAYLKANG
jgi:SET domain-containing protein